MDGAAQESGNRSELVSTSVVLAVDGKWKLQSSHYTNALMPYLNANLVTLNGIVLAISSSLT